jgi:putative nucleotidyltransferase with HDIG domain
MLKKISVTDVQMGMHIKEFCGSWMDHPFWKSQFVVANQKDLDKIKGSAIREVVIDTDLGLDVPVPAAVPSAAEVETDNMAEAMAQAVLYDRVVLPDAPPVQSIEAATAGNPELAKAAAICNKATAAVSQMFQEARMGKSVDTDMARQVVQDITESVMRNGTALISLARLKTADDYTYMHSVAVCALMVSLARQLKLSEADTRSAGFAGLIHDIGKMSVPLDVLNKPGKLTDDEFTIVKGHPQEGFRILQEGGTTDAVALDVCLHHHEKVNGSGYPKGLKENEISLFAKMGAVCDVYDAITSNRPYKKGWDPAQSLKQMASWANGHFDPKVFQAFVSSLGIYPTGSLVMLDNNMLAVVIDQSESSLLKPKVRAFFSLRSAERVPVQDMDLSSTDCKCKILGREDPEKWNFTDLDALWTGIAKTPGA